MLALRRFLCTSRIPRLDFEDSRVAFQHKTTWELFRALAILRMCGVSFLVDNSLPILRYMDRFGGRPLLRRTLYEQFVGGANPRELTTCSERVFAGGMRCMLAATMEEDVGERSGESVYESNCSRILSAVEMSSGPHPMIQLKLSGLLPAGLLVKLGQQFESPRDVQLHIIKVLAEGMEGHSCQTLGWSISEEETLRRALRRLFKIGQAAQKRGVRVLVDAEQTYLNRGLSAMALAAVSVFNQREPVVWNTYQCYLRNAWNHVQSEFTMVTEDLDSHFGAKVVRGAYLLQERIHAKMASLPDPTCPDYETTCRTYDRVTDFLLNETSKHGDRCQFVAATHNEHSIRLALRRMEQLKVDPKLISFAQLYGMCDQVSGPLASAGYAVYKSIPFGTLEEVLPYLARRAVENRSVLEGARSEPRLLATEIKRRFRTSFLTKQLGNTSV